MKFSHTNAIKALTGAAFIAFFLFSCDKGPLDPKYSLGIPEYKSNVDSFNVRAYTFSIDSLNTWGVGTNNTKIRIPFGIVNDPLFGTTHSEILCYTPLTDTLNTIPIYDYSSYIDLVFETQASFGAHFDTFNIDVHEFIAKIEDYTLNSALKIEPDMIGNESINSGAIHHYDTTDTKKLVWIRLPLKESFSEKVLNELYRYTAYKNLYDSLVAKKDTVGYESLSFEREFEGLYLKPVINGGGGSIFNSLIFQSHLTFQYKKGEADSLYSYKVFKVKEYVNLFNHEHETGELVGLNDSSQQQQVTYLQSLSGLKNIVKIDSLSNFKQKNPNVRVIRAELLMPIAEPKDTVYPRVNSVGMAFYNRDNDTVYVLPEHNNIRGEGWQVGNTYVVNMTSYMISYMFGVIESDEFQVYPGGINGIPGHPDVFNPGRTVINSGSAENPMRIKIYYTNQPE